MKQIQEIFSTHFLYNVIYEWPELLSVMLYVLSVPTGVFTEYNRLFALLLPPVSYLTASMPFATKMKRRTWYEDDLTSQTDSAVTLVHTFHTVLFICKHFSNLFFFSVGPSVTQDKNNFNCCQLWKVLETKTQKFGQQRFVHVCYVSATN